MVTIRFELNEENIRKYVGTEAGVEKFRDILRKMYVEDRKAEGIAPLVYQRDDENAMCDLGVILDMFLRTPQLMDCFTLCEWDVDGEVEDIIAETKDYMRKHPRKRTPKSPQSVV